MVEKVPAQKHLGFKLDKKLSFKDKDTNKNKDHLKDKIAKVNRGNGILKKLSEFVPRHSLITL